MGRSRKNKKKNGKDREKERTCGYKKTVPDDKRAFVGDCGIKTQVKDPQPHLNDVFDETRKRGKDPYLRERCEFALALYSKLIELSPRSEVLYWSRMKCFMMIDQYERALADAKKSVEVNPRFMKVYDHFIDINIALGDFGGTKSALAKLSSIDPKNILLKTKRKTFFDIDQFVKLADSNYAQEKFEIALNNINKALDVCTHCILFSLKKGEYLLHLRRFGEAEILARDILDRDEANFDAKYILAHCLYESGEEKLFKEMEVLLDFVPPASLKFVHDKVLCMLEKTRIFIDRKREGNKAFQQKNYRKAHRTYFEALKIDPKNGGMNMRLLYNMAQAAYKMGEFDNAGRECTRALIINPNYIKALKFRGKIFLEMKNYDEAIKDFSKAYQLDPQDGNRKMLDKIKILRNNAESEYYKILGVKKNSSMSRIVDAYQYKARESFFVEHSNASMTVKEKNRIKFREINRAFKALGKNSNLYDNDEDAEAEEQDRLYDYYYGPHWRRDIKRCQF